MNFLLLAGDIGGTNTRLLLKREEDERPIHERNFTNSEEEDLASIVREFLDEAAKNSELEDKSTPHKACFAVAGPVDKKNNTCTLTNLNWTLDGNQLATDLKIERVQLINDFEAVGYGVLKLAKSKKPDDIEVLQEPKNESEEKDKRPEDNPTPPIGVIGAGTGLGEAFVLAFILREAQTDTVFPTEGGHVDFAARSQQEFDLLKYIKDKYDLPRVSVERVVSGPGIVAIYQFLRDCKQYSELEQIKDAVKAWEKEGSDLSKAPSQRISAAALGKENKLCEDAMKMFAEAYGSEVGNFALKLLPYRGLYVAGGIAPQILQDESLRESFLRELKNKGRMKKLIERIPIYLVKNEQVGLIGAAHYAERL
jgi:glucokinase